MDQFKWSKEAEKQWDNRAGSWSTKSKEMWDEGSRKKIVPFFGQYVPKGSKVCDLGCGDGYGSYKLFKEGYKVTGIDFSEQMVNKARSRTNEVLFEKGDISNLDIEENTYDAVMAINSLEWTESPLAGLMEMKKVVKDGGLACIGILGPTAMPRSNSYRRLYGEKVICNTMMIWEFEQLAIENGWTKVADLGVYKRGADQLDLEILPAELKQALTFMWVFMLKNSKE
ncbi:class I SAM-dependent methyltransferase [Mesobacillus harenae]|uniref:class I SAM-dependent methyltransferase n=1 Tax=Mesobacillus harenae TaxID=2213203 RepID=UPI001580112B|nr:class I SAM-dependent methyltransferase [Mesobacillus harenae]